MGPTHFLREKPWRRGCGQSDSPQAIKLSTQLLPPLMGGQKRTLRSSFFPYYFVPKVWSDTAICVRTHFLTLPGGCKPTWTGNQISPQSALGQRSRWRTDMAEKEVIDHVSFETVEFLNYNGCYEANSDKHRRKMLPKNAVWAENRTLSWTGFELRPEKWRR